MLVERKQVRRLVISASGLLMLGACLLVSHDSEAELSFTLAMDDVTKASWDKRFNELATEPFAELKCAEGSSIPLKLGEGCVDAGTDKICCESWEIPVTCAADHSWSHEHMKGTRCKRTKSDDEVDK